MTQLMSLLVAVVFASGVTGPDEPRPRECVVLLHGLARGPASFRRLAQDLEADGYAVVNMDYPSRQQSIEELAAGVYERMLTNRVVQASPRVHFVTHSLGGILVRRIVNEHRPSNLGRVVMISPPNQGSELVAVYEGWPLYRTIAGPAGLQLGVEAESVPNQLGPVDYEVGVIAGTRTVNPILSMMIPGPDDGKVSVARTRVEGMTDFIALPHSHVFITLRRDVREQVRHFLKNGSFQHARPGTISMNCSRPALPGRGLNQAVSAGVGN